MNLRKSFEGWKRGSFCFYCSVDSDELRAFLIVVIGGLVLASAFVALGAWLKGYFRNIEDPDLKRKVLELEGEDHGQ